MNPSRRGLFGLFAGAAALPLLRGLGVAEPIQISTTGLWQRYTGYEVLNITPADVLAATEYDWREAVRTVTVTAPG